MPYLSTLEVCSRQGAIQIHVYVTLPCLSRDETYEIGMLDLKKEMADVLDEIYDFKKQHFELNSHLSVST